MPVTVNWVSVSSWWPVNLGTSKLRDFSFPMTVWLSQTQKERDPQSPSFVNMALTNIFAVLTYLVSFTFLKTKKGHDLLVTADNHHYWKEWEKDTKFGLRKYWVCAYGDKYGCKSHLTTTMDSQFVNWGLKNVPHNHVVLIIKTEGISDHLVTIHVVLSQNCSIPAL